MELAQVETIPRVALTSLGDYQRPAGHIERAVCDLWGKLLNVAEVGADDDYFALGGTSLQALEIFENLNNRYRLAVPVSSLYIESTPKKLATRIVAELNDRGACRVSADALPACIAKGPGPALFLIPGLECEPIAFEQLGRLMRGRRSLYGMQLPGMYGDGSPCKDLRSMATALINDMRRVSPTGPYHLLGQCGGGLVAMEMARQLHAVGEAVPEIIMLDPPWCYLDPCLPSQWFSHRLKHLGWLLNNALQAPFAQPLRHILRCFWSKEKNNPYTIVHNRVIHAYQKAVRGYIPRLCGLPVTYIGLPERGDGRVAKWQHFLAGKAEMHEFSGISSGRILHGDNVRKLAELIDLKR